MSDSKSAFDLDLPADVNLVEKVRAACEEAAELKDTIDGYAKASSAASARLQELVTREIPTAMAEAGCGDLFSLESGHKIKLGPFVSGSLPTETEARDKAFKALAEIGGESLIKTHFSIDFGKGEKQDAERCSQILKGEEIEFTEEEKVHASSLKAFVKEALASGSEVPLDTLGLYAGTVAKITPPKKEKN